MRATPTGPGAGGFDERAWLAHLRTDRRGIPVPYVNAWGPRGLERTATSVRHDAHVGADALFLDDAGQDEPDFTRQHMGRQRECVIAGLCQVCGRGVPWSRRWLVVADLSVERIEHRGRQVAVVTEPWLDSRCLDIALARCPALIRRSRAESLTPVAVTSRREVTQLLSYGWVEGELEEATRERPPVIEALGGVNPAIHGQDSRLPEIHAC